MSRLERSHEFLGLAPLAAVLVLGVNDVWLKPVFHNALTGKLSDFAGCFFLPLYLSTLLGLLTSLDLRTRLGLGAACTGIGFAAVKVSQRAADAVVSALSTLTSPLGHHSYRIIADPTDLIALPMILLAVHQGLTRGPAVRVPGQQLEET